MGKIQLIAGSPNDTNRDYLPEAIKGSDMVVNENGNNSQVYPKRLKEYKDILVDGLEDIWYEYVPESYDPAKKTPLVFSMHGGLMTGWGQAIYTCWTQIADREGFICIFPNANARRFWTIECEPELKAVLLSPEVSEIYMNPFPDDIWENHDANLVLRLLDVMKEKYNIDEERIYMQGMSLGNAMTTMMARYYGNLFAGMSGSAGPANVALLFKKDGSVNNMAGPVAVMQTRMELDGAPLGADPKDDVDIVVKNREYWLIINECEGLPKIKIDGENNFAFYNGKKADYVFRDVKNRDHGQTFDDAEIVWDYLFSGVRRKRDGSIETMSSEIERKGDDFAISVCEGSDKAWANNQLITMKEKAFKWQKLKYHGLNGDQIVRGEYFMVPISFIAEVFEAEYLKSEDGGHVILTLKDGRVIQFARGCIGCTINDRIRSMLCEAVEKNGELYISIEWFTMDICGYTATSCDNTIYITNHYAVLSKHMARLISDLLLK